MEGERRAAAETNDVELDVTGFCLLLEALEHLFHAASAARPGDATRDRARLPEARADARDIEFLPLVGFAELEYVGVRVGARLVFVPGAIERIESHLDLLTVVAGSGKAILPPAAPRQQNKTDPDTKPLAA
jgi:hypothetical protein